MNGPTHNPRAAPAWPVFDLSQPEGRSGYADRLARLRSTTSLSGPQAQAVAEVVEDVRTRGDDAVVEAMRRWTDPGFEAADIVADADDMAQAEREVDPAVLTAVEQAIANVRAYQAHVLPKPTEPMDLGGGVLGMRWSPVDSAGLCVPGGTAPLFSTLVMLAVPALVAGVPAERLAPIHPPPTRAGDAPAQPVSPVVLAVAGRLGLPRLYRIGGAQGVAALAYGTESVPKVDFIAGPGNVFVQLAKAMVSGACGTEGGFYGPSEVVVVADPSARADRVAADLLAQAEHDPGKCFLVAWDAGVIERVEQELARQLAERGRSRAIVSALETESAAVLVRDENQAVDVVNDLATEHLTLAVQEPEAWLERVRHAGEVFLGDATPVAVGDYWAGPSHCLPTGTTARFASGVSVYTFLKRTGTVAYPGGLPADAAHGAATLAECEGLDAHAQSLRVRLD
ncbi:MAG: histidinol dehydrogenase [Planctomycetota bacterium]